MGNRRSNAASRPLGWLVPAVVTGSLVPFAVLGYRILASALGPNPVATALNQLGLLALTFLVACLACAPAKVLFGVKWPLRVRKTLGLFAFFAALLHFLTYAVVDQELALGALIEDVAKRPFIALGFTAFLGLAPLAATSTKRAVLRLGFARWKRLHRLVYAVGILSLLHFVLRVKADRTEPLLWAAVVGCLLAVRVVDAVRELRARRRAPDGA